MKRPGSDRRRTSPDSWASDHERAQYRAAQRLDGPLGARESGWLDEHLAGCSTCASIAEAYADDRRALRSLSMPEPPRDLWARTSAALDQETATGTTRRGGAWSWPMGALAGVLVVAVVLGASVLGNRGPVPIERVPDQSASPLSAVVPSAPRETPIMVAPEPVGFVQQGPNGSKVGRISVREVCAKDASACQPVDTQATAEIKLPADANTVIQSPNDPQLIVVEDKASTTGGDVFVVDASAAGSSSPSPTVGSPSPSATGASTAPSTPPPSASAPAPASATPATVASPTPSPSTSATPSPSIGASASPSPSASPATSGPTPILSNVILVGQSAAYSRDGRWFAFTARPADGSHGPDIYVWSVGQAAARPLTSDHRSIFSAWIDSQILGSRATRDVEQPAAPSASAGASPTDGAAVASTSFLIDPSTARERALAGDGIFRPVVDPTNQFVVYWRGTIRPTESGRDWRPAEGNLVLARWDPSRIESTADPGSSASASTSPGASSGATAGTISSSPVASPTPVTEQLAVLSAGALQDWDARWDESGQRFALWIANANDEETGLLSLYSIDPTSGLVDDAGLMRDRPARAGFSIGNGRLAWLSGPTDRAANRIDVLAWTGRDAGTTTTTEGTDVTLIR